MARLAEEERHCGQDVRLTWEAFAEDRRQLPRKQLLQDRMRRYAESRIALDRFGERNSTVLLSHQLVGATIDEIGVVHREPRVLGAEASS